MFHKDVGTSLTYLRPRRSMSLAIAAALGATFLSAQAPSISAITPSGGSAGGSVMIAIAGGNFGSQPVIKPSDNSVMVRGVSVNPAGTTINATLFIPPSTPGFTIVVNNGVQDSNAIDFSTGVVIGGATSGCTTTGQNQLPTCSLLQWEVDANGITAQNGQTNSQTAPNALFKLDYLMKQASVSNTGGGLRFNPRTPKKGTQRMEAHLLFETGIMQAAVKNTIQPVTTGTAATPACPGTSAL